MDFVFLAQVDEVKDGNNTGLKNLDFVLWEDVLANGASDGQALEFQSSFLETQPHTIGILPKQENEILGQLFTSNFERQELGGHPKVQEGWQVEYISLASSTFTIAKILLNTSSWLFSCSASRGGNVFCFYVRWSFK